MQERVQTEHNLATQAVHDIFYICLLIFHLLVLLISILNLKRTQTTFCT